MKRSPIVLTATAAGFAAALGFTPHAGHSQAAAVIAATSRSSTPASGSSSTTSSAVAPKTVNGGAISTRYGNVQVKVTVSGTKITNVEAVQLPYGDPKSSQISTYAAPMLRQSALDKQTASVDAVSGATYTSDGYATALQSALDKAGLKSSASATTGSG